MDWPWSDLGSLPDWVEALGTSGALFYIPVQHHSDRRRDREEKELAAATRRDTEASQARLISVDWSGVLRREARILGRHSRRR